MAASAALTPLEPTAPTAPLTDHDEADDAALMYGISVLVAIVSCVFTLGFLAGYITHRFF
jgi:hypothetical protein